MSRTGFVHHTRFLDHLTGAGHPERPDRLRAVERGMSESGIDRRVVGLPDRMATDDEIKLVHTMNYIDRLKAACATAERFIDTPDSAICDESEEIARLTVGGILNAADAVMAGEITNAFGAVRPPGHHATADRSAGFCLYNNIALAARYLQRRYGVDRIAIIDWDVHHGDGTQAIFWDDPSVLFCSLHEDPRRCYPGTGFANETGGGLGTGFTLNVPIPSGRGDEVYRRAFDEIVTPRIHEFAPEVILISDGFDAHRDDPLAGVNLSDEGFDWMMQQAVRLAEQFCRGRLIATLEGGYDLGVLQRCVPAHVSILLESSERSR